MKGGQPMYINMLDYIGTIFNKEKCISELKSRVKELRNLSDSKVGFKINENHKHDPRYFTDCYKEVTEDSSSKLWMWVDSGYTDKSGCSVYFQFRYSLQGYTGALVGTAEEIIKTQSEKDEQDYILRPLGVSEEEIQIEQSYIVKDEEEEEKKIVKEESEEKVEEKEPIRVQQEKKVAKKVTKIDSKQSSTTVKRTSIDVEKTSAFYQELYDKLLIQTGWELTTSNLRYYIDVIITRLNSFLARGIDCSEYVIFNEDKSVALINSGLLDKFGKNILFISNMYSEKEISFTNLAVVQSKSMLIQYKFDKTAMNNDLQRVKFYNEDASELVFTGDIEDFDLENWDRLTHCISDRKDRFPDEFKNASDEVLCSDLIKAVELGVQLSKYDTSYIKPIYNKKYDSIHFIIPYHVGNNFQKKPELGIVIANYDNIFWNIMTILSYDDCYRDIKIITPYETESF